MSKPTPVVPKFAKYALLVVGIYVLVELTVTYDDWSTFPARRAAARTQTDLHGIKSASTNFHEEFGRWPLFTGELVTNASKKMFMVPALQADMWGRPFLCEPFSTNTGYGRFHTLGRDGQPGGTGRDTDYEVRFP